MSGVKKFLFPAFAAPLFFIIFFSATAAAEDLSGYVIGKIFIRRLNVFNLSDPAESGAIPRAANKIHTVTQETTIRQELLFQEGDLYDQKIIDETARNLRKHAYLTDVRIDATPDITTKTVNVMVSTRDQWSLLMGLTAGGTSENSSTGFDFGELNLAGLGQTVSYSLRHDNFGYQHALGFADPNVLGSRYSLKVGYAVIPTETDYSGTFEKPFYALNTESAHGASYVNTDHNEPGLRFKSYRLTMYYAWAAFFGENILRTYLNLSFGEQTVYSPFFPPDITRDNKVSMLFNLLVDPRDFVQETYIDKFRQTEDIPLGANYSVLAGQRMESLGSTSSDITLSLQALKWHRFFERDYLVSSLTLTRNDDQFNDQFGQVTLQYYLRRFTYQTFVFRVQGGYLVSDSRKFYLGGTNGLRGYKVNEFAGKDELVFNLEDRIFTYTPMLLGIIEPGFVLFVDSGNAWNNYPGDRLNRLNTAFGAGVRIALLKAPGISLIRVDYGVPTDFNRPPVITVGMEGFF